MSKANIVLDASKIDLFETCAKRYQIRHILNKTLPVIQKASALDYGTLLHSGYETYYRLLKEEKPYQDRIHAALMKVREKSADPDVSNSNEDEVSMVLRAVEQSLDFWRHEDEMMRIIDVEVPFLYVLFEDDLVRILLSGMIDLLVDIPQIGRSPGYEGLPIDHKSFQRESPILRKSNQFINYAAAVGSNYLIVNKVGLQKTLKAEDKFKRVPLSYDPIYIQDWKDNLTKMILHEYLTCVSTDYWPEKPTSCNKFNRLCEYYDVCDSSGADSKQFKLESNYIDGEVWDVTKRMVEK